MLTFKTVLILIAFLLFSTGSAYAYPIEGSRGYESPDGARCLSEYPIRKGKVTASQLVFWSNNRKWIWSSIVDSSIYFLEGTEPKAQSSITGELKWVNKDRVFSGWIIHGDCGNGWIKLKLSAGSS